MLIALTYFCVSPSPVVLPRLESMLIVVLLPRVYPRGRLVLDTFNTNNILFTRRSLSFTATVMSCSRPRWYKSDASWVYQRRSQRTSFLSGRTTPPTGLTRASSLYIVFVCDPGHLHPHPLGLLRPTQQHAFCAIARRRFWPTTVVQLGPIVGSPIPVPAMSVCFASG